MYEKTIRIPLTGWDLSSLFLELQNVAGEASAQYHASGDDLAKHGLMWVVVRYEVRFAQPVLPGDTFCIKTWAMPFRHRMSQRNYHITDKAGNPVITAAGIWTVVDRNTRKMVDPSVCSLQIPTEYTEFTVGRPADPEKVKTGLHTDYIVQKDDLDTNAHMNNARYFHLAERQIGASAPEKQIALVRAAYYNEARLGERIGLSWGCEDDVWYFCGRKDDLDCFEISIRYRHGGDPKTFDFQKIKG